MFTRSRCALRAHSFTLALLALFVVGCATGKVSSATAIVLYFAEQEPGGAPEQTRMLVTPAFLRIDSGSDENDFLLYDRAARVVYSVSAADRLVLEIASEPLTELSATPASRVERIDTQPPSIGGRPVSQYRLWTGEHVCYELYAADGLLPEAVAALREYREHFAGAHARLLAHTPMELRTPCDFANQVQAPARYLAHGFPIRVAEIDGRAPDRARVTELVNYQVSVGVDAALFTLPESYRRMRIEDLRGR